MEPKSIEELQTFQASYWDEQLRHIVRYFGQKEFVVCPIWIGLVRCDTDDLVWEVRADLGLFLLFGFLTYNQLSSVLQIAAVFKVATREFATPYRVS